MKKLLLKLLDKFVQTHYNKTENEWPYWEDYIWKWWKFEIISRQQCTAYNITPEVLVFFGKRFLFDGKV